MEVHTLLMMYPASSIRPFAEMSLLQTWEEAIIYIHLLYTCLHTQHNTGATRCSEAAISVLASFYNKKLQMINNIFINNTGSFVGFPCQHMNNKRMINEDICNKCQQVHSLTIDLQTTKFVRVTWRAQNLMTIILSIL